MARIAQCINAKSSNIVVAVTQAQTFVFIALLERNFNFAKYRVATTGMLKWQSHNNQFRKSYLLRFCTPCSREIRTPSKAHTNHTCFDVWQYERAKQIRKVQPMYTITAERLLRKKTGKEIENNCFLHSISS